MYEAEYLFLAGTSLLLFLITLLRWSEDVVMPAISMIACFTTALTSLDVQVSYHFHNETSGQVVQYVASHSEVPLALLFFILAVALLLVELRAIMRTTKEVL